MQKDQNQTNTLSLDNSNLYPFYENDISSPNVAKITDSEESKSMSAIKKQIEKDIMRSFQQFESSNRE